MQKLGGSEMKKKVLGRGLGALIGESAERHSDRFLLCPIDRIRPNKRQPRKKFDTASLTELADSIKENGIIEPLVLRKDGVDYELIAGERRLRASIMAGLKQVPAVILEATDVQSLELAIVENIQRQDLNPIEEADAYQSLVNVGMSQEDVSKKVGKDRATVANYLRLLKLPPEVKDELLNSAISMGHARAILALSGHAAQRELCRKVITKGLSVRETERLVNSVLSGAKPARKKAAHLSAIEEELRRTFGTKVSVVERNGRGKVEIEFYSPEERERVIDILRQA